MIYSLLPHPSSAAPDVKISVEVARAPEGCHFSTSYQITGDVAGLIWKGEGERGRSDELWRHGCFEAFVRHSGECYVELNAAPTARWAAYEFDRYRMGMRPAPVMVYRQDWVRRRLSLPRLEMHVLWELPATFAVAGWHLALSAVIEETDGTKSYWALAHAPGPPDFHNPACFTATLPPPAAP